MSISDTSHIKHVCLRCPSCMRFVLLYRATKGENPKVLEVDRILAPQEVFVWKKLTPCTTQSLICLGCKMMLGAVITNNIGKSHLMLLEALRSTKIEYDHLHTISV